VSPAVVSGDRLLKAAAAVTAFVPPFASATVPVTFAEVPVVFAAIVEGNCADVSAIKPTAPEPFEPTIWLAVCPVPPVTASVPEDVTGEPATDNHAGTLIPTLVTVPLVAAVVPHVKACVVVE
jgi:hypothetical protein